MSPRSVSYESPYERTEDESQEWLSSILHILVPDDPGAPDMKSSFITACKYGKTTPDIQKLHDRLLSHIPSGEPMLKLVGRVIHDLTLSVCGEEFREIVDQVVHAAYVSDLPVLSDPNDLDIWSECQGRLVQFGELALGIRQDKMKGCSIKLHQGNTFLLDVQCVFPDIKSLTLKDEAIVEIIQTWANNPFGEGTEIDPRYEDTPSPRPSASNNRFYLPLNQDTRSPKETVITSEGSHSSHHINSSVPPKNGHIFNSREAALIRGSIQTSDSKRSQFSFDPARGVTRIWRPNTEFYMVIVDSGGDNTDRLVQVESRHTGLPHLMYHSTSNRSLRSQCYTSLLRRKESNNWLMYREVEGKESICVVNHHGHVLKTINSLDNLRPISSIPSTWNPETFQRPPTVAFDDMVEPGVSFLPQVPVYHMLSPSIVSNAPRPLESTPERIYSGSQDGSPCGQTNSMPVTPGASGKTPLSDLPLAPLSLAFDLGSEGKGPQPIDMFGSWGEQNRLLDQRF
ncbi:hypothetical protein M231_05470 [Tremella mesenterica]|uniref:Uncharacterized protein n=1 Tax=Tremella mesenterica TaxID=5217 RepID=A0A4Q1BHZ3_TREME|nr:hypothetical protein M231_05470 [Tremella mesenterica]